jgi:hypothetical protein
VEKGIPKADVEKQKEMKKELLRSKIDLGRNNNDYSTTYLSEHTDKGYVKDFGKSQEIMKDLRSQHYKFGYNDVGSVDIDCQAFDAPDGLHRHQGQAVEAGPLAGEGSEVAPCQFGERAY